MEEVLFMMNKIEYNMKEDSKKEILMVMVNFIIITMNILTLIARQI